MRRVPRLGRKPAAFETDVLAAFVLARAAAGLADATIRSDVLHLEQLRAWFGRSRRGGGGVLVIRRGHIGALGATWRDGLAQTI